MSSWTTLLLFIVALGCGTSCHGNAGSNVLSDDKRPLNADSPQLAAINAVLQTHADRLMAIPGVVGLAVGLLADEETPCLKVMIAKKTPELEASLPKTLDGHPVVVEESGTFRPLENQ